MYISLKWRVVIFISVVSVLITTLWAWQTVDRQLAIFDEEIEYNARTQTALLDELFDDSYLKLSQIAQLISSSQASFDEDGVSSSFEQKWFSINLLLELDYMAFFDNDSNLTVQASPSGLTQDEGFVGELVAELKRSSAHDEPRFFVYCNSACLMVVLEPFIGPNGDYNTIAIAQNMSDLVRIFFNLSKSSVTMMVETEALELLDSPRYVAEWSMFGWAGSDFTNVFPVLKNYANEYSPDAVFDDELFKTNKNVYLVKELDKPNSKFAGNTLHFYSVTDKTESYQEMLNSIKRGVILAVIALAIALTFMITIVSRLMNKLIRITRALLLLPKQEFDNAVAMVHSDETLFEDELSVLEKSTAHVAGELKKLHHEINFKNESLADQVAALTRSRAFLTRLFDNSHVFIVTQDESFKIQSTNRKFDELYDASPRSFCDLIQKDDDLAQFYGKTNELFGNTISAFQQELTLLDKGRKSVIVSWTHTLVEDEQGSEIILSIGMDQTQQKSAETNLRWMANHDGLTGIGNRRSFNAAFNEMLSCAVTGALVFIDVNRFKHINDIYGHNVGDQVLVDIAEKLRVLVRSSDKISRFAGDEFTILLHSVDRQSLPEVLQKLNTSLNHSITSDNGQIIHYSVSIGAALFPEHGTDSESLLINADMAMYHAKKKGLGYWHVFDTNDARVEQIKNDHSVIESIRYALENYQFKLVYQPIISFENDKVSHYEALVRMFDERGNMISPGLFIPLAERSGLIRKIDEWVLDNAVQELSRLACGGVDYCVAINVSAPTLQSNDLPDLIVEVLEKHDVKPASLIVELTETAYIENFQQVLKNLRKITHYGVRIALDDFGVGFSSFNYLKMLPLTYVKLDGSYIKNITQNPDDQVFVKSLSAMINAFGMKTVAEFVEDENTLAMIQSLGVTHGQGYHLGMPKPIQEAIEEQSSIRFLERAQSPV
ncbi:putative bifunctional diguanylate cyclase/phosphodiesterase [Halioxenophilus aromaticivorans]|uniref:Uncharacterized protein n=1 Tax=Halioxenophilus aromaticivorans TaxID=1306992 RepID=A0AAV3U0L3_9ALTE